jgi:SET domain-containing protein
MIAKCISVCGAPLPTGKRMTECLSLCMSHHLKIKTACCDFNDEMAVRKAWEMMEKGECWEAPIVEMMKMTEMMSM